MAKRKMLSRKLLSLRKQKDVSLRTAAKVIGCSHTQLARFENGDQPAVPIDILQSAAGYYGVTVGYLIGESETA